MTTVRDLQAKAGEEPITMLTAYDAVSAALVEAAGVDVTLVGDSVGNASLGYDSTLPVTREEIASRVGAVARGTEETLVVADMPFLTFGVDDAESVRNCGRMLKEAGANAVKIESGPHTLELTERLADLGVPVMAHVGLTPQSVHQTGYTQQGHDPEEAREIARLAAEHEDAGAFACVLEHIPANLAAEITATLSIPTIGIGAGPDCDGQVLVINDAVGLGEGTPPFAKAFGDVRSEMEGALESYVDAVESGEFPAPDHYTELDELDELDDIY
jgi:3-methyl-2-oxobutanoate hydroxymethyltransferase